MSKPTLGRGLGDLLGSNRAGAGPAAPVKPPGVGLRILIDGAPSAAAPSASPSPVPAPPFHQPVRSAVAVPERNPESAPLARAFVFVALLAADLALIGWAAHHVVMHRHGLNLFGMAACAGSVLLAGVCGCAAAWVAADRD